MFDHVLSGKYHISSVAFPSLFLRMSWWDFLPSSNFYWVPTVGFPLLPRKCRLSKRTSAQELGHGGMGRSWTSFRVGSTDGLVITGHFFHRSSNHLGILQIPYIMVLHHEVGFRWRCRRTWLTCRDPRVAKAGLGRFWKGEYAALDGVKSGLRFVNHPRSMGDTGNLFLWFGDYSLGWSEVNTSRYMNSWWLLLVDQ